MNPYGGQNPGQHPGGPPSGQAGGRLGAQPGQWQGGYPQAGYPQVPQQSGYSVPQDGPAGPQGTQRFGRPGQPRDGFPAGHPYGNGPVGGSGANSGGGGNKGLIIALVSIVAVLAVAGAVALGVSLRSEDASTASPVTFSAGGTTTTAGAPTTGAVVPPTEPATQSDGFLTTAPKTTTGSSTGQTVRLRLSATGTGAGAVLVVGVQGNTIPKASTLPWEWQGTATIGDRMSLLVTGTGPVNCTIVVNEQEFTQSGTNTVDCTITRVASP